MLGFLLGSAGILGTYFVGKSKPELLLLFSHEATLVLCSIFILLHIAGLRDGFRYTGVAFALNAILHAIFG